MSSLQDQSHTHYKMKTEVNVVEVRWASYNILNDKGNHNCTIMRFGGFKMCVKQECPCLFGQIFFKAMRVYNCLFHKPLPFQLIANRELSSFRFENVAPKLENQEVTGVAESYTVGCSVDR